MQFYRSNFSNTIFILALFPVSPSRYQEQETTPEDLQNIPLNNPYEMLLKENENFGVCF